MRGITGWATYLPHWRLDRSTIGAFVGKGGGRGTQDSRQLRRGSGDDGRRRGTPARAGAVDRTCSGSPPRAPPYLEKTNATIVHAALRLDDSVRAHSTPAPAHAPQSARCFMAARSAQRRCWSLPPTCAPASPAPPTRPNPGDGAARLSQLRRASTLTAERSRAVLAEVLASGQRQRRVHRPLAHARRPALEVVGRQVRLCDVHAAGRRRLEASPRLRRACSAEDVDVVAVAATSARLASALSSRLGASV